MDEILLLNRSDILKALRNSYLQSLIESEINVKFYKWKAQNLSNGESVKLVKENQIRSEHNVETASKKIEVLDEMLNNETNIRPSATKT